MPFAPVARLDEIPDGRGLRVELDGIGIGLYRVGAEIHAMEDACPHAGFPLSRGRFVDGVVVCAAHGLCYDVRTGFDPEHADGFPIPRFRVRIVEGRVEVDLADRLDDPRVRRRPSRSSGA